MSNVASMNAALTSAHADVVSTTVVDVGCMGFGASSGVHAIDTASSASVAMRTFMVADSPTAEVEVDRNLKSSHDPNLASYCAPVSAELLMAQSSNDAGHPALVVY